MASITLDLAGFAYSYTITAPHVQRIMAAYQHTQPGLTNQQVADLIVGSWMQYLIEFTQSIETEIAIAAAKAGISPITITEV